MAGLGTGAAPMGEDEGMPAPEQMPADGMQDATPEEQALYDKLVKNAMKLAYGPELRAQVREMLTEPNDPIESLATTAVTVFSGAYESAEKNGVEIPGEIAIAAGQEVVEQLADYSAEIGGHDYSEEEMEGAFFRALDKFRVMRQESGKLDTEALKQDFAAIQQAEQSGALEQDLMGMAQAAPGDEAEEEEIPPEGEEDPEAEPEEGEDEEDAPPKRGLGAGRSNVGGDESKAAPKGESAKGDKGGAPGFAASEGGMEKGRTDVKSPGFAHTAKRGR